MAVNVICQVGGSIEVRAKCQPFAGAPMGHYKLLIEDNNVLVWDNVAGHYTANHKLSRKSRARIRKEAQEAALIAA